MPKAMVCIVCGTGVSKANSNATGVVMNEFNYEQKGDSKKVNTRFTNDVGNTFAETLASILGISSISRKQINPFASNSQQKTIAIGLPPKTTSGKVEFEDAEIVDDAQLQQSLGGIFSLEEGKLILTNPRLKQTGKLDNAIRLAILTIYAYELAGNNEMDRSALNEVLGASKLEDGHFRTWIAKCDEIINNGGKVRLSVPGREAAKSILREVMDEDITKGSIVFSKTSTRGTRKKRNDKSPEENPGNSSATSSKKAKGPLHYLNMLIQEKYFIEKRKIGEILEHIKVNKAETYKSRDLSPALKRAVKSKKLKRETNSDGQYEYFA